MAKKQAPNRSGKVNWSSFTKRNWNAIVNAPSRDAAVEIVKNLTGVQTRVKNIQGAALDRGIALKWCKRTSLAERLSPEKQALFKKMWPTAPSAEIRKAFPELKTRSQRHQVADHFGVSRQHLRGQKSIQGKQKVTQGSLRQQMVSHIRSLLPGGFLETDPSKAIDALTGAFREDIKESGFRLNRKVLTELAEEALWDNDSEGTPLYALKNCILHEMPLDDFSGFYPYIPASVRDRKVRELKGLVSAKRPAPALHGVGRLPLERIKPKKLARSTFGSPFQSNVGSDKPTWTIGFVNGSNLGFPHTPIIEDNVTRRAFEYAKRSCFDALILSNLIDIETKKAAGPSRVLRALVSGRNLDPAVFDPGYVSKVNAIMQNRPEDEVIYETRAEVFEDLLGGWYKISHTPKNDNEPEYHGPVYVVLGVKEEELAAAAAYWHVGYHNRRAQLRLRAKRSMAVTALKHASTEEEQLQCEAALNVIEREEARTRITNVEIEWRRFFQQALTYIVRKIEESIPNAKVIGKGTSYLKVGTKTVEINIPSHVRVTDSLLADRVSGFAQDTIATRASDVVVVCHPHALSYRATAREVSAKGKRVRRALVCVAPIAVDDQQIRDETGDIIKKSHPILQAVKADQFRSGILRVDCVDDVLSTSPINSKALGAHKKSKTPEGQKFAGSYMYYMIATDQHHGGRGREPVWVPEVGDYLGICETVFHMMRKAGYGRENPPPIHFFSSNDDLTQGNHFDCHKHPHPHHMQYHEISDRLNEMIGKIRRARGSEIKARLLAELKQSMMYQFEVRAYDWVPHQLSELFHRLLRPNADMFSGILLRATNAGVHARGISHYLNRPEVFGDRRDIGILNWGSGNHIMKTADGQISEGMLVATQLRLLLETFEEWKGRASQLERLVTSPLNGNRAIGWGTLQAGHGYEWGIDIRDTVPRMAGWMDPLKGAVKNESQRGNYSDFFEGRVTIKTYGDKHFFGAARTQSSMHVMGPSSTHTDEFGENGFPPNNTGVVFIGLPVDGPDAGPILIRPLFYQDLVTIVANESFPWEEFLPNAA